MDNNRYFIPLLLDALDAADPAKALAEAFQTIQRLGNLPGYEKGFAQFEQFMAEVAHHAATAPSPVTDTQVMEDIVLALATGALAESDEEQRVLESLILAQPAWCELYEHIRSDLDAALDGPSIIELVVKRDQIEVGVVAFPRSGESLRLKPIAPGLYTIGLSTGRVLWEGEILIEDTCWKQAFPERAMRLAADTEGAPGKSTKTIPLLGGTLMARIYPGMEAGVLEFTIQGEAT